MQIIQNRRRFLAGAAAAGAAGLLGTATPARAEPPPETTSVRLPRWINSAYCWAGLYLAGELLRAEARESERCDELLALGGGEVGEVARRLLAAARLVEDEGKGLGGLFRHDRPSVPPRW